MLPGIIEGHSMLYGFFKGRIALVKLILAFTILAVMALTGGFFQAPAVKAQQAKQAVDNIKKTGPVDVDAIVKAFSAKETQFRLALNGYAFKRDATVQTIGMGGNITGEYRRVSSFVFDDSGNRFEKITFFPAPTLTEVSFTQEDLEDLGGVQPFALEASKLSQYNFDYLGTELIDEIDTHVFDVKPKVLPKKLSERLFQGRVWVDTRDQQIVKVRGKGVPEDKNNAFPIFETYRQQIDGRYWFPVYTYADDTLAFGNGTSVHLRMLVKYTDFKRFSSQVKITEADEPVPSPSPSPAPAKKP
jgi:hypothetical protein